MKLTQLTSQADVNDTISEASKDINTDNLNVTRLTSQPESTTVRDNIYHFIVQHSLSLDPLTTMALGNLDYNEHFHLPHFISPEKEGRFGKTLYKRSPPSESKSEELEIDTDELSYPILNCSAPGNKNADRIQTYKYYY